jgi:methylmalonyl-CoA mutase N-terminal domain/subunit
LSEAATRLRKKTRKAEGMAGTRSSTDQPLNTVARGRDGVIRDPAGLQTDEFTDQRLIVNTQVPVRAFSRILIKSRGKFNGSGREGSRPGKTRAV